MRDVDLREINWSKVFSRRVLLVLTVLLVLGGGAAFTWHHINHPPRPWLVRWKLDRYLAKQARTGDFKVDFAFPSKAEMARRDGAENQPAKGSRTGKDFETLREEYLTAKTAALRLASDIKRAEATISEARSKLEALTPDVPVNATAPAPANTNTAAVQEQMAAAEKLVARRGEVAAQENALAPVVDDLWELQRTLTRDADSTVPELSKARAQLANSTEQVLGAAPSYEAMYKAVGQELFVAKRLLESGNPDHRREGVLLALSAARQSVNYIMNGGVAARICEGYVLPHLDLATDRNPRSTFNEDNLLSQCADYFRRNEEPANVVRTYELALANAKTPAQKDRLLAQIARVHEQSGDAKAAIATIRKIQDTTNYQFLVRRIPRLEQDAKYQN